MNQLVALTGKYTSSLTQRARYLMALAALGVVAVALVAAFYLRSGTTPLFVRPLESDQLGEVTQRLSEWNIPFTSTADNVNVDSANKNAVMLRLGMFGVPHAHVATTTEALQAVNALTPQTLLDAQQRTGLEGDLALALRRISGISDARVMIAPATRSGYVDEATHDASASVSLTLDSGATLAPEAVTGIRSYVANSVTGLAPERVQIIDQNGVSLDTQAVGRGESEDKPLEASLQSALDRTVGQGLTFVLAHVELDPTAVTRRAVRRAPVGNPIANDSVREHYTGKDRSYDKLHQSSDRGSETVETNSQTDAGMAKSHSVAVFVDQSRANEIPRIRQEVAAGAGLDAARGDQLVVQTFSFPHAATAPLLRAPPPVLASVVPSLRYWPLALVALIALTIVARLLNGGPTIETEKLEFQKRLSQVEDQVEGQKDPERVYATLKAEPIHVAATLLNGLSAATTAAVLEFYDQKTRREIVKRLARPVPPVLRDLDASAAQRV